MRGRVVFLKGRCLAKTGEAMKTGSGDRLVRAVQTMYMECDTSENEEETFSVV